MIILNKEKTASVFLFFQLLLVLCSSALTVNAQNRAYFKVDKRKINIQNLNRQIDTILSQTGIPGLSLAIISNNKVVFNNGYGHKSSGDTASVNKNTIFEGCSLSKSFLVYLAYVLLDEHKLDLDKPLYQYMEYDALKYDDRYKLITARMVLNHSSGIENWQSMNNPDKLEIINEPGAKFSYSGEGYHYLAKVFEVILKMPYERYISEMVYQPLGLKRTFSFYSADGSFPENYAVGHDIFGKKVKKMKNSHPVPAAGVHFDAEDYAKLVVATFDKQHLSENSVREILKPIVSLREYASVPYYYGQGYEVQFNQGDTIISQGGNNPGFKALVYYSTVSKNGMVIMANSDRGKWIAEKISELTVKLPVHTFFEKAYQQYPSPTIALLKVYDTGNSTSLLSAVNILEEKKRLQINTLNELSDILRDNDITMAKQLLEINKTAFPSSSKSYYLLASINIRQKDYQAAVGNLIRAKELKSDEGDIDQKIEKCRQQIEKAANRK